MFARLVRLVRALTQPPQIAATAIRRCAVKIIARLAARARAAFSPRPAPAPIAVAHAAADPWLDSTIGELLTTLWRDRWQHRRTAHQGERVLVARLRGHGDGTDGQDQHVGTKTIQLGAAQETVRRLADVEYAFYRVCAHAGIVITKK